MQLREVTIYPEFSGCITTNTPTKNIPMKDL